MTNTRITDPEILERRYPVILRNFSLSKNTGGAGHWRGGDGVSRELLFRKKLHLSVLTERRVYHPYGINGGQHGQRGSNLMFYADGRIVNLGGKTSVDVSAGDIFSLMTPGGGGYGRPKSGNTRSADENDVEVARKKACPNQQYLQTGSVYTYNLAQESA